jgi:hypothetical protein
LDIPYPKLGIAENAVVNGIVAVGVELLPVLQAHASPSITLRLSACTKLLVTQVGVTVVITDITDYIKVTVMITFIKFILFFTN